MGSLRRAVSDAVHPLDVAIALGLAALSLVAYLSGASDLGPGGEWTIVLLLLQSLPLVVRRRFPLEVMLVVTAATLVHLAIQPEGQDIQAGLGVLVAIYTVGERLDRPTSIGLTALTGVIAGILLVAKGGVPDVLPSLIQTELIMGVAWLLGDGARIRRLYTEAVEEQARQLERDREERTQEAVRGERERIARELHDVVAHHVSVMVIQAGGGLQAIDKRPAEARTSLEAIARTGRQALADMRRMVGILGADGSQEPTPGLDRLDDLIEQVRAAGLIVELRIRGVSRRLDPGLEVSAYRIIQESLTNSLKHAGGRAEVTVGYEPRVLEITIEDVRGPGPTIDVEPTHVGRGLVGMRERVALFRGAFDAHPTTTGFRVTAQLPLDDVSAS